MTHNQINYWSFRENERHNLEFEKETQRHNVEQEKLANRANEISYLNAQANLQNASTNWYLAPSKEFNNYAVSWDRALVAGAMLGINMIKKMSDDGTPSIKVSVDNRQPNIRNQRLVEDPHGGQLYVSDY